MHKELMGVTFEIDDAKSGPAFFILGIRKSGSSMLNRVGQLLSRFNSYNFVDVAGRLFTNNIKVGQWIRDPSFSEIIYPGNVYGGFRNCPLGIEGNDIFRRAKKVLLVRDPRDALVSEYFSNAYSHSLPQTGETGGARGDLLQQRQAALATPIDDYVLGRAKMMRRTVAEYLPLSQEPNTLLLKYEDVIFAKDAMVQDIVGHFGWVCRPKQLEAILGWVDVKPQQENPKQFIRKVTPGDHQEKLRQETIDRLNDELADVLETFGYA
ncbi:MAG TPA: sulfotransferase domain-containing protein [Stellaceae bacterium]|nr:sulfotransferase domain-containing protein [Stellaceae bacterium]